jgi:hypothetical protein
MATKTKPAEADETHEDPEVPDAPDSPESGDDTPTLAALDAKLDSLAETVANLARGGKRVPADSGAEVASQVKAEVAKIKQADDAERAREDRLRKVEGALKKVVEVAPREYRRITKIMWGSDSDED